MDQVPSNEVIPLLLRSPADGGCVLFADPANGRVVVRKLRGGGLDDQSWRSLVEDVVQP